MSISNVFIYQIFLILKSNSELPQSADRFNSQHQLHTNWMNRYKLDKVNLNNNSRQYIHTCCLEAELGMLGVL